MLVTVNDRTVTETIIELPALRFADTARRLGAAAHEAGLSVPAFRSPPRVADAARTIRRYPAGAVVSVRLRGRPFPEVVADMVDGVLAANRVPPADAPRVRARLAARARRNPGLDVAGAEVAHDAHTPEAVERVRAGLTLTQPPRRRRSSSTRVVRSSSGPSKPIVTRIPASVVSVWSATSPTSSTRSRRRRRVWHPQVQGSSEQVFVQVLPIELHRGPRHR